MVGSGDQSPTIQAFENKFENALSSFSRAERPGSARLPTMPIFFNLVSGTL